MNLIKAQAKRMDIDSLLPDQIKVQFKINWYLRWLVLGVVAASVWYFLGSFNLAVFCLMVFSGAYNLTLYVAYKRAPLLLKRRLMLLAFDGFLVVCLMFLSGGLSSPYRAILALLIISVGYWYGIVATIITGLIIGAVCLVTSSMLGWGILEYSFVIQLALYICGGIFVGWLSKGVRIESNLLTSSAEQVAKYRSALDSLLTAYNDAVLVVDKSGLVTQMNQAAANLLTSHVKQSLDNVRSMLDIYDSTQQKVEISVDSLAKLSGRNDLFLVIADGSKVNIALKAEPISSQLQTDGYVVVLKDISAAKSLEEERNEFIAVASHELRTPLTIAQGYLSIINKDEASLSADNKQAIEGAERSLNQLTHIIGDLIRLSDVNAKMLPVDVQAFDPIELISDIVKDFDSEAQEKGLQLKTSFAKEKMGNLFTSRFLVQQILSTLISNAIKFTDKGEVKIEVAPSKDKAGVLFTICDTGIGIAKNEQPQIFTKFFQSENYMKRSHGGTGLGLFIASKLAKRLTAKLWFESEKDHGSRFFLQVPSYDKNDQDSDKVAKATITNLFSGF